MDGELRFKIAREGRELRWYVLRIFQSLPWNITSMVHKIRTTLKRRSNLPACIGKPLPPQSGIIPASLKSSSGGSGGSSNPSENEVHLYKEILREDRIWTAISGWQICRRHSVDTLIFKCVWFDWHHGESKRKVYTHTLLTRRFLGCVKRILKGVIIPVLRRGLGKNSCTRIDCHCLHRRRFKTRFEICKDEDGELSDIRAIRRHSAEIIIRYVMIHYKGVTHYDWLQKGCRTQEGDTQGSDTLSFMRIKHEINILLNKLDWWQKKKNVKKEVIQSSSPTVIQTKQKQLQMSRSRGRWIIKSVEDQNKMQSTNFYCPRRKNEFW